MINMPCRVFRQAGKMSRRRSIHYVERQLTPHDGKSHGSDARRNNDMFKTIEPKEITRNPFTLIGDDWMLVTAEKDGKANTMTTTTSGSHVFICFISYTFFSFWRQNYKNIS